MNAVTPAPGRHRVRRNQGHGASAVTPRAIPAPMRSAAGPLLAIIALLMGVFPRQAAGQWPWSAPPNVRQQPHPAIVRVNVEESDGISHGSGTLIDVRDKLALVITNWHVVRDATGPITVVFPDGFRSPARVLRVDRDWDLSALLIWRPPTAPLPLASSAPRPGEVLTIAGYGAGDYRAVSGRCTQYVAPSENHPFEMVELSAKARQGDSGGPILNAQGELAGVLFGSDGGTTSGSYVGRVHQFVRTAWPPQADPESSLALASIARNDNGSAALQRLPPTDAATNSGPAAHGAMSPLPEPNTAVAATGPASPSLGGDNDLTHAPPAHAELPQSRATSITWQDLAGDSLFQQGKTFLAILGLFTLLAQLARLFSPRAA